MLINFQFENYRSFREAAQFSMIAGLEKQHKDTLTPIPPKNKIKLLPVAAIFGGNASGKTGFCEALEDLRNIVLEGKWSAKAFRLPAGETPPPISCKINVWAHECIWEYSIATQGSKIVEESLTRIQFPTKTGKEIRDNIFTRDSESIIFNKDVVEDEHEFARIQLSTEICGDEMSYICFARTIKSEPLIMLLFPFFGWMVNLTLISSEATRIGLSVDMAANIETFSRFLQEADTGINQLNVKQVKIESLQLTEEEITEFEARKDKVYTNTRFPSHFVLKKEVDGQTTLQAYKCITQHKMADGRLVEFSIEEESEGTQRLLHLMPAFMGNYANEVIIIDEIDRSLHTVLSRKLIEKHLDRAREDDATGQLIFTTHDVMLMDQNLLRRDEIWVIERDEKHESTIYSCDEFKELRSDKNIRRSYLLGRMGGIPKIY